ncbi:2TM domain-containing protein [Bacteroidales bacterium OttesenSCG-928-B11]|nr:2TM domain-containing protein [Bacteroidales bacterium OttesenSCG-928-E04]MDL2308490.1 2TM domain-containing protein [Bacteroidales bacterium OttesenSCG-928-C03]MDL2311425.1 2TM domain-containing protein [Bacteroidales bacterium OttesenSCG-928-B11]
MNTNDDHSEEKLAKKASKRAGFKIHAGIYILVNLFFWVIWIFLFRGNEDKTFFNAVLFLSIAWLIALIAHYLIVYKWNKSMVEKELDSLKKEMKQKEKELEKIKEQQNSDEETKEQGLS